MNNTTGTAYAQLSLLDTPAPPTSPVQPFQPVQDVHYGLWRTIHGPRPWGWEGYGDFEHLYDAKIATEAEAIAAAEAAIKADRAKL